MKPQSSSLFLLTILAAVILASGCTGLDPTTLAKSNSLIQQFMNEHPNAQIKVTHFTAEQAKNIIDQIRSDCDNPYLDEKEFYRVNITDPETNFFAVVWIDWSTKTVECVFKIGTEGKVVEKPKIKPECESHASYKCDSGNLYWFDSCGNIQDKKEYCQYGCSGEKCLGECKSQAEYRCYGDHVYWFDSCGNKQEKKEYCNYGCENGFCKSKPPYEKTCEEAGGYCIYPQGYCGDGICQEGENNYCPPCTTANPPCMSPCKAGTCPQDCGAVPYPGSGGGGTSDEAQSGCEKKCTESDIKFADFRADKEIYSTGEVIRFYAKLIDNDGRPATPEEGNKVYFFAVSPTAGSSGSSAPTNYNYSSGYYESTTPPIPTSNVESGTWIFFATAEKNESFAGSEDVYVKINPTASAALPTANPAPYEGCVNRCLMRFRMAEPLKPVMQPSSAHISTGMVVAMEVTATSTIVTYQCREGYEVGNYFCKEGGICCIPKTTPPPSTEFCGSSTQGPCASDSECITGGCSGQVCQSIKEQSVPTTCEYKDCYNAEKYGMACRCIHESITPTATAAIIGESSIQGRCKWVKSETIGYCKDSDGGKNYYVKGIVTGNDVDGGSMDLNDVCEDKEVHEYFCQEPNPNGNYLERQNYGWVNYPCPYGCKEGVCMKETPICTDSAGTHKFGESWTAPDGCNTCYCKENGYITCTNIACTTCTDSDGGLDYYTKGSTLLKENGIPGASGSDFCTGVGNDLMEYICQGSTYTGIKYNCPNGCSEGACTKEVACATDVKLCPDGKTYVSRVPPNCDFAPCPTTINCTDSDAGRYDYYTKGTITTQQGSFTDFCVSPTMLTENYCDYSYYAPYQGMADSYTCPYGCQDGTCLQQTQPKCADTDGGVNYYVKGTASASEGTMTDYCANSNTVVERYCGGPHVVIDGPAGTEITAYVDGACKVKIANWSSDGKGVNLLVDGSQTSPPLWSEGSTYTFPGTNRTAYVNDVTVLSNGTAVYVYIITLGDQLAYYYYGCPNSCNDGACV